MTRHNITIDQGATYQLAMTLQHNGSVLDLTGATLRGQLRTDYADAAPAASFAATIIDAAAGQASLLLTAEQTAALPAGLYVYDVELEQAGAVTRLFGGRATVSPEVTR